MEKVCTLCGVAKSLDAFAMKIAAKDQRQSRCRFCQRGLVRQHYQKNTEYYVEKARVRNTRVRTENQEHLYAYLLDHPCVDCGEPDPVVLQFDHTKDKSANIADLMRAASSWATILVEIGCCEVRCANCHTRKTAERGAWWRCQPR